MPDAPARDRRRRDGVADPVGGVDRSHVADRLGGGPGRLRHRPRALPPPDLLNEQLLSDPASFFYATAEQNTALRALESEAVAHTLEDYQLPAADAQRVMSWGRDEALAELWALLVQAISTDPSARTETQRAAVAWMTQTLSRKAREVGINGGWEYLKWAGRVSATATRPEPAELVSELDRFDKGTLQPVNYRNGTPDNSDSGYCAYVPPTGLENTYDGNPTKPNSGAAQWCYPPYLCPDPLGCDNRQPTFETFVSYGEARVFGDPSKELQYSLTAKNVGRTLMSVGAALAAGIAGGAIATGLGSLAFGTTLASAVLPFVGVVLPEISAALYISTQAALAAVGAAQQAPILAAAQATLSAELAAAQATGSAVIASSVAAVVVIAIVAIAIAVIKGVHVVEDAAVPGKLRDLISNSLSGTPNLQEMLSDGSDLRGLFGLFIRAAGPRPQPATCDNSLLFTNLVSGGQMTGSTMVSPCANATAIPQGPDDYQFLVQRLGVTGTPIGPSVRTDTLSYVDQAIDSDRSPVGQRWTNNTRLADGWFVTTSTFPDGTVSPANQSLRMTYSRPLVGLTTPVNRRTSSRLEQQSAGGYKFLTTPEGTATSVAACSISGACPYGDSIDVLIPSGLPDVEPSRARVSIVPALRSTVTIGHSADPVVGTPVTLTATDSSPELGGLTYQWYIKQASGLVFVCPPTQPYCDYEGPFSGQQVDFTWQGSGSFKVILVATDRNGRKTTVEKMVDVGSVGPQLSVNSPSAVLAGYGQTLTGTVIRPGSGDNQTLTVQWGDGTTLVDTYTSSTPPNCSGCNPDWNPRSATELDWRAMHTWANAGTYEVVVTVVNDHDQFDRKYVTITVDKAPQLLSFDPISDHGLDDLLVGATVTGGPAGTDVVVASTTPDICIVESRDPSRVDGQARASAVVRLVGAGTCTLRAIQDGDADHLAAGPVTTSFDVGRGTQTIHFPHAEGPLPLGTAPFDVSAAGGATSRPVLISSSTPDVCTASESEQTSGGGLTVRQIGTSTITLVGAGQCTLTVTQDGDADYFPAESATWSFDVLPKQAQALAFPTPDDATYGDDPVSVSLTGGGSSEPIQLASESPDVCVVSSTTPGRDGGVATLTATIGVTGAGDCLLTASQAGDGVYEAAEPVTRGFTVARAAQALHVDAVADHTYGDEPFSVTATGGSSVAPVEWATKTPGVCRVGDPLETRVEDRSRATSTVTVLGAGVCQIVASQAGTADFAPAEPVIRSFTVDRQAQVLDFPPVDNHVFGDPAFEISATGGGSTSPASLTGSTPQVCTLSDVTSDQQSGREQVTATVHLHGSGVCTITAAHSGDDNHLAAGELARSFAVGRAGQSIAFAPLEQRTYGSPAFTVAATGGASDAPVTLTSTTPNVCTVAGSVDSRVAGLATTTSTVTMNGAGSCAITAAQAGTADYAAATSVVRSFAVAKAALTIAVEDRTMIVGGPLPPLTYRYVGLVGSDTSGVVTGTTCSAKDSAGAVVGRSTPVGDYQIVCSGAAAANYEITYQPGTLRVHYLFSGINGYSVTTVNQVKAGATVSVRWTLKDATGKYISSRTSFASLTTTPMTCGGPVPASGAIALPGGTSAPKYDTKTGTWTYNWKTSAKLRKACVALTLNLADGTSSTIRLRFKGTDDVRRRSRSRLAPLVH